MLQSLTLMNGVETSAAVDVARGPLVTAVAEGPFDSDDQRVETLFLAALGRLPDGDERTLVAKYLAAGKSDERRRRTADVVWALVNTAEFGTNH
ncbi:MAG: hypothetical protein QM775_11760 [Pirellulales bacterium]